MNRLTLARLADILAHAQGVWKDRDQALDFLSRKHAMLEQRKPVDLVLESEQGARRVRDLLTRLERGSAA